MGVGATCLREDLPGRTRAARRGRFEARLALLRRGEPAFGARPEQAPEHGAFWLAFSRLCAVLRRATRHAEG